MTSTKQFVWALDKLRPYQFCEERDGSGTVIKKFFNSGQTISGSSYFYTADHLANPANLTSQFQQSASTAGLIFFPAFTSSIREMTNSSGVVQSEIAHDPFGRASLLQGTSSSDFQFGDYYIHARSALNLTLTRAYSSNQGRFINRDLIGEDGGSNLYSYVGNHPVLGVDPSGNCAAAVAVAAVSPEAMIAAGALGAAALGQAAVLGNTVGKFVNSMVAGDLPGSGGRTPVRGRPNSKVCFPDGHGGHTEREYGPDGNATTDTDYGHDHGAGNPHQHEWNWSSGSPVRGPGVPMP
ncbi:hypothetical protein BH10CYA1_BH10CYA1_61810 [soil metagenome]